MIVGRLLKVRSVGSHLEIELSKDDLRSALPPTRRAPEIRKQYAQRVECNGLAQQMGIGEK